MYIIERVVTTDEGVDWYKTAICTAENHEIARQVVEMLYIQKEAASKISGPFDKSIESWKKYDAEVRSVLEIDPDVNPKSKCIRYRAVESKRHFTNITKD